MRGHNKAAPPFEPTLDLRRCRMFLYNTWPLRIDYLYYKESEINSHRSLGGSEKSEEPPLNVMALFTKENVRGWIYGLTEDFRKSEFKQKAPMAVYQLEGSGDDYVELDMLYSECSFFCSKLRSLNNSTACCRKVDKHISNLFLGKTMDSLEIPNTDKFNSDIYQTASQCSLVTNTGLNQYYINFVKNDDNIYIAYKCPRTYMTEIAYPIFLKNKVIAVLIVGQFVGKDDIVKVNEKIDLYNTAVENQHESQPDSETKLERVSHIDEKNEAVKDKDQLQEVISFFQNRVKALQLELDTRYAQNLNDLVFRITNDVFVKANNLPKNFSIEAKGILSDVMKQISANRIILFTVSNINKGERNLRLTVAADTNLVQSKEEFTLNKQLITEYKNSAGDFKNENIILVNDPGLLTEQHETKNHDKSFLALLTHADEIKFAFSLSFGFQMNSDDKSMLIEILAKIGIALFSEYEITDSEKNECLRKYKIRKDYAKARNELIYPYAYRYHIYHDTVVSELLLDTNLRKYIRSDDVSVEEKKKALNSVIKKAGLKTGAVVPIVNGTICEYLVDKDLYVIVIAKIEFYIRVDYPKSFDGSVDKAIINIESAEGNKYITEVFIESQNINKINVKVPVKVKDKDNELDIEVVTLLDSMIRDIDLPFINGKIYGKYALKMDYDLLLILLIDVFESSITRLLRDMYKITTTKSFRHLQYKTQVMLNSFSDDQTTRLMHSMAVSSIASTLAKQFHANWELVEAIAIGHDVGHTPFGHAGEEALDKCLSSRYFGRFQHALQGVKVLNNYEQHKSMEKYGLHGIGISKELLIGILKHDTDMVTESVYDASYQLQYDIARHLGEKIEKYGNIETQIVYWSDKIAYLGHDWEEFSNSKIMEDFYNTVNDIYHNIIEVYNTLGGNEGLRSETIKKEEYRLVINILELIKNLKNEIDDKNYIDLEHFVISLRDIIRKNDSNAREKIQFSYITENHYNKFFSYFEIADAWSRLLDKQISVKPNTNDNFIQIIHNFLINIKADQVASELHNRLVAYSYDKIIGISSVEKFTKRSEEKWAATKKKYKMDGEDKDHDIKSIYQEMLLVTMDPDKDLVHIKTIKKFISTYYHDSVLVKGMNMKAERIIKTLFKHYTKQYKMLPPEYRQKYYKLTEANIKIYKASAKFESGDEGAEDDGKGAITQLLIKNLIELKANMQKKMTSDEESEETNKLNALIDTLSDESEINEKRDAFINQAILSRIVADYIASMTDRMAIKKYNELNSSEIDWSYVDE